MESFSVLNCMYYFKHTVLHPRKRDIEPEKDPFESEHLNHQTSLTWAPWFRHQEPTEPTPQLTGTQKAKELNRALRRLVLGGNGVVNAVDRSLGI